MMVQIVTLLIYRKYVLYKPANVSVHIFVLASSSAMCSSCDNLWKIAAWFTCPHRSASETEQKPWGRVVSLVPCENLGMDRIWQTLQRSPHYLRDRNKDQSTPDTSGSHWGMYPCTQTPLPHPHCTYTPTHQSSYRSCRRKTGGVYVCVCV